MPGQKLRQLKAVLQLEHVLKPQFLGLDIAGRPGFQQSLQLVEINHAACGGAGVQALQSGGPLRQPGGQTVVPVAILGAKLAVGYGARRGMAGQQAPRQRARHTVLQKLSGGQCSEKLDQPPVGQRGTGVNSRERTHGIVVVGSRELAREITPHRQRRARAKAQAQAIGIQVNLTGQFCCANKIRVERGKMVPGVARHVIALHEVGQGQVGHNQFQRHLLGRHSLPVHGQQGAGQRQPAPALQQVQGQVFTAVAEIGIAHVPGERHLAAPRRHVPVERIEPGKIDRAAAGKAGFEKPAAAVMLAPVGPVLPHCAPVEPWMHGGKFAGAAGLFIKRMRIVRRVRAIHRAGDRRQTPRCHQPQGGCHHIGGVEPAGQKRRYRPPGAQGIGDADIEHRLRLLLDRLVRTRADGTLHRLGPVNRFLREPGGECHESGRGHTVNRAVEGAGGPGIMHDQEVRQRDFVQLARHAGQGQQGAQPCGKGNHFRPAMHHQRARAAIIARQDQALVFGVPQRKAEIALQALQGGFHAPSFQRLQQQGGIGLLHGIARKAKRPHQFAPVVKPHIGGEDVATGPGKRLALAPVLPRDLGLAVHDGDGAVAPDPRRRQPAPVHALAEAADVGIFHRFAVQPPDSRKITQMQRSRNGRVASVPPGKLMGTDNGLNRDLPVLLNCGRKSARDFGQASKEAHAIDTSNHPVPQCRYSACRFR